MVRLFRRVAGARHCAACVGRRARLEGGAHWIGDLRQRQRAEGLPVRSRGLEGVLRALSFIGLGVALIAIGLVYQKLVFARPAPPLGDATRPA